MKKLYIPTMEELKLMEDMGANVYKYLLIKTVESLVLDGRNYPSKGVLKNAYKYLQEDPYISYMISLLYPSEVQYSKVSSANVSLCARLITQPQQDRSIYTLDRLASFPKETIHDSVIVDSTLMQLDQNLARTPQYRFEYQTSSLLEDVFSTELAKTIEMNGFIPTEVLSKIEPGYALALSDEFFEGTSREEVLKKGLEEYTKRYGFVGENALDYDLMIESDIRLENEKTKRLIRCIDKNTNRY